MSHSNIKRDNEVYLDKRGIINTRYYGEQTAETLESTHGQTMRIIVKLLAEDKPILLLADITDMGRYDLPARFVEMHARTVVPFWRLAIVTSGLRPIGEKTSRQLTAMSGRKAEIRYFQREDDAKGWLLTVKNNNEQNPKIKRSTSMVDS